MVDRFGDVLAQIDLRQNMAAIAQIEDAILVRGAQRDALADERLRAAPALAAEADLAALAAGGRGEAPEAAAAQNLGLPSRRERALQACDRGTLAASHLVGLVLLALLAPVAPLVEAYILFWLAAFALVVAIWETRSLRGGWLGRGGAAV